MDCSHTPERRSEHRRDGDARTACYQEIRRCMKAGIQQYYQEYPDRLLDDRSKEAIERSLEGLRCIFVVLDQFEIGQRK